MRVTLNLHHLLVTYAKSQLQSWNQLHRLMNYRTSARCSGYVCALVFRAFITSDFTQFVFAIRHSLLVREQSKRWYVTQARNQLIYSWGKMIVTCCT